MRNINTFKTNLPLKEGQLVVGLLILIVVLNLIGLYKKRLTYDEGAHYQYGLNILEGNSDRFDDSKMPFSALNAVPRKIWDRIEHLPGSSFFSILKKMRTGRHMTIWFSVLLGFFIYRWARELYGPYAGIFSLGVYAFSPNILAHSRLITNDLYLAGMVTISLYCYWHFMKSKTFKNMFLSAFTLGLAQLAKYTAVYLYPLFALIALVSSGPALWSLFKERQFAELFRKCAAFFKYAAIFLVTSLLVINAGFLFNKSLKAIRDYNFESDFFKSIQLNVPNIPVPLPEPYVKGLDLLKFYDQTGDSNLYSYLFGQLKKSEGFKGYYFYAFMFKEPLAVQIVILISTLYYLARRKEYSFFQNEVFLLVPVIFFSIYFNFFSNIQIGIRYFLVVFPLLYIFSANMFKDWIQFPKAAQMSVFVLMSYMAISVLSYAPHFLSYFNEFVWNRKNAYKILADSNLDWGENTWYLERYQKKHPDVVISPQSPVAGRVIVGVNELLGINTDPRRYQWLRDHLEPAGHVAYSYLIFDVTNQQLEQIRQSA